MQPFLVWPVLEFLNQLQTMRGIGMISPFFEKDYDWIGATLSAPENLESLHSNVGNPGWITAITTTINKTEDLAEDVWAAEGPVLLASFAA